MAKSKSKPGKRIAEENMSAGRDGAERQAVYFLSLSLENVRCFGPEQTLDLSDGNGKPARWTIILGINGTGKTTILQSLVGFELLSAGLSPRFYNYDIQTFLRNDRQNAAVWNVKVAGALSLADSVKQLAEYHFHIQPSEDSGYAGQLSSSPAFRPWCCGYGANRRMGATSLSESGPDDSSASLFSDKADLRNPEEWLLWLDYAAAKPSEVQDQWRRRLTQVKELLLRILPEVEDIRFTTGGFPPTFRVELQTPYGWVPLRQLGYGYQTLITWVADLANRMVERYPDSPNPLAEPAVVAVDEIDLHLHPLWQRKLMGFLTERFPNTQFIATSHSPLMAQAAADANLAVLRREGDHVVIDNDVDNIRNWRVDQILTSDLFGLETARPPQIERLLVERGRLLEKPKLTAADERRLKELEEEIGELPFGETPQERKEREEIRKTLDLLTKERPPSR